MSSDGKKLLIYQDKKRWGHLSVIRDIEWSEPEALKPINTKYYENHATYSADGRYFFFISNREADDAVGGRTTTLPMWMKSH
ncbi:MAG: hypothetical protein R2850_05630 [Bacteroidia bacterium]